MPRKMLLSKKKLAKPKRLQPRRKKIPKANKDVAEKEKIPKANKDVAEKEKNPKPKKKAAKKTETGMVKELKISLQKLTEEDINNNIKFDAAFSLIKENKVVESTSTESNATDMIKQE